MCIISVHRNMAANKRLGQERKLRLGQTYENRCLLIHNDFFFFRMISFIVQIVHIPNGFILFVWRCVIRLGFLSSYPLWIKVYYRGIICNNPPLWSKIQSKFQVKHLLFIYLDLKRNEQWFYTKEKYVKL